MPKLQHIRVAGWSFCQYEIPEELTHLWKYIKEMYQLDAFTQSNPADQDILNIYKNQQGVGSKLREELMSPSYTTSVPASIADWALSRSSFNSRLSLLRSSFNSRLSLLRSSLPMGVVFTQTPSMKLPFEENSVSINFVWIKLRSNEPVKAESVPVSH